MHGLDGGEILLHNGLHGAASLLHIPQSPAQDAHIGVRLHKDADVHQLPQPGIVENEDALHDDHRGGPDEHRFIGAVVVGIGVYGAADSAAGLQLLQLLDHQVCIEGIGVVIVLLAAHLKGDVLTLVVVIVMHHTDGRAEVGGQVVCQGGFAAAGAPGDADDHGIHRRWSSGFIHFILL